MSLISAGSISLESTFKIQFIFLFFRLTFFSPSDRTSSTSKHEISHPFLFETILASLDPDSVTYLIPETIRVRIHNTAYRIPIAAYLSTGGYKHMSPI